MGLFERLRFGRGSGGEGGPAVDPACGDAELAGLIRLAETRDWPALRDGLAAVPDQSDLTWMIAVLSDVKGSESWLPGVAEAEPDSALPLLLSGARHISWGWEARTGAYARHVSREQWELFHQRLEVAEQQLYEAAEREPDWLAPWYFLQISGRGASIDGTAARYRFEAALRRRPDHLGSHKQRLQQVCAKWGGSHEEMHAFATEAMRSAPGGSPLGELVAHAHIERWLELDYQEGHAYITRPAVADELHEALHRSILHPDYRRPRNWKAAYNTFAMVFSLLQERAVARPLFEAIGDTVTEDPWHYLGRDPAAAFRTQRDANR